MELVPDDGLWTGGDPRNSSLEESQADGNESRMNPFGNTEKNHPNNSHRPPANDCILRNEKSCILSEIYNC